MTPTECVQFVAYVKQLVPSQRFEEYTPDAWHGVLEDLPLEVAIKAAQRVVRQRPYIDPHAILEQARLIRDEQRRLQHSEALALPSRFEQDISRDVRIKTGLAGCHEVLDVIAAKLAAQRSPEGELDHSEQTRQRALQRAALERRTKAVTEDR